MSDKNKQTADVQLLDVLERVTESDLQSIDEKIAELQRQIDGLTAVRRVIDRRLHGSPTRTKKPAANKAKGGGGVKDAPAAEDENQRLDARIAAAIRHTGGPLYISQLVALLNVNDTAIAVSASRSKLLRRLPDNLIGLAERE